MSGVRRVREHSEPRNWSSASNRVDWQASFLTVLFVGTLTGAYFSAHYSEKIGNVWIKRLFIMIVSVMVLKLLI